MTSTSAEPAATDPVDEAVTGTDASPAHAPDAQDTPRRTASALKAAEPSAAQPAKPGRTELGRIDINDRVVEKIAARATIEIPDAGAAAPRVLGRSMAGIAGHSPAGIRQTSLDALPKTSADIDGSTVTLDLQISVRWPSSIPDVTSRVRGHVADRVAQLTGLSVTNVRIQVTDLVTHLAPPPRVH